MQISTILSNIAGLPESSITSITQGISEVSYPKGHLLLRADRIETTIYFIKKGMVRAYAQQGENEITFWFGKEGETVISMKSYVENQKGYENIELLEASDFYELKTSFLKQLFDTDINIANWGRRFAEQELLKTEERLLSRQIKTASERYYLLMKNHPELIQRIQLGYIASYLGITQVSLSRIRKEIR